MTRKWRNYEVVTAALRKAGGANGPIHIEEVAEAAHELAPERFSWTLPKYRNLPDKDLVRVSLYDAEKETNRAMVESSRDEKGNLFWRLTSRGAEFCAKHETKIQSDHDQAESQSGRKQHRDLIRRIRQSRLWKRYQQNQLDEATEVHLTELLRLPPDSPSGRIAENLDGLRAQVELTRDAELLRFLDQVGERFELLLGPKGEGKEDAK